VKATHIFSSDLQRAYKTAEAICTRQNKHDGSKSKSLAVVRLPVLREQDFGSYEGQPTSARPKESMGSGTDHHRSIDIHGPSFKEIESKDAMARRMNNFLNEHLVPLVRNKPGGEPVVIVVSHGLVLGTLWKCLLSRFKPDGVRLGQGLAIKNSPTSLQHLGGWSNTGYMLLNIGPKPQTTTKTTVIVDGQGRKAFARTKTMQYHHVDLASLEDHLMVIKEVNSKDHLQGLKRTGGGVGSSRADESQLKIESYFKKTRVETRKNE
jgi:broad specificity phosphatase PhoE